MTARRLLTLFTWCFVALGQTLFSQILLQGKVTDNGAQYLGNGAEPVVNALVTVTDHADSSRSFSATTDEQGQYVIHVWPTGVKDVSFKPGEFILLQNYPNPFNPSTIIGYEISRPAHVTIQIYNIMGRKVKTLLDGFQNSSGQVVWDATNDYGQGVPAGVYVYSMMVDGNRLVRKMTLVDGPHHPWSANFFTDSGFGTSEKNGLKKKAEERFTLTITGQDIETYEQKDLAITADLGLDVSVMRTVTDFDGNVYRTVKIGDQWWMAENLKVTHYCNGEEIPNVTGNSEWSSLSAGAYCDYGNNIENIEIYGRLYNWFALNDDRKIVPDCWHVSNEAEWLTLINYLGGNAIAGGKLKEDGTIYWHSPNTGATNESGFTALPGGFRSFDGTFFGLGSYAMFWNCTENSSNLAWDRFLAYNSSDILPDYSFKQMGFSVRFVRD